MCFSGGFYIKVLLWVENNFAMSGGTWGGGSGWYMNAMILPRKACLPRGPNPHSRWAQRTITLCGHGCCQYSDTSLWVRRPGVNELGGDSFRILLCTVQWKACTLSLESLHIPRSQSITLNTDSRTQLHSICTCRSPSVDPRHNMNRAILFLIGVSITW